MLNLLSELIGAVCSAPDAGTLEKVRCIGGLAPVVLQAIKTFALEERLEAIEAAMRLTFRRGVKLKGVSEDEQEQSEEAL